ncbi:hypothetical protein VNO77_04216 [Canavalia gladiata]|uniref:Uncharacterized protein n=1 Tax=Canavalia gladiata TaxID=3824 RepID=A0AAN9MW46_CANGL
MDAVLQPSIRPFKIALDQASEMLQLGPTDSRLMDTTKEPTGKSAFDLVIQAWSNSGIMAWNLLQLHWALIHQRAFRHNNVQACQEMTRQRQGSMGTDK